MVLFFCSSCYTNYGRVAPVSPMFGKKKEFVVKFYPGLLSLQNQLAYSPINHLGILASGRLSNIIIGEIGVLGYFSFDSIALSEIHRIKGYVDIGAGIGKGISGAANFNLFSSANKTTGAAFNSTYLSASTYVLFLGEKEKVNRFGIGMKWNALNFLSITHTYESRPDADYGYKYYFETNNVKVNFIDLWTEVKLATSKYFHLSIGISYTLNVSDMPAQSYRYNYYDSYGNYELQDPPGRYPTSKLLDEELILFNPIALHFGLNWILHK